MFIPDQFSYIILYNHHHLVCKVPYCRRFRDVKLIVRGRCVGVVNWTDESSLGS